MSNITFAPFPIPVVVDGIGECYIVSQTNSGTFEDDLFLVAKCDGGHMFHVRTSQMKMHFNATIGIHATPKEYSKFYEGQSIPVTPHTNIGTVNNPKWSDEDMVRFCSFCKFAPGKEISEQLDLFKEEPLSNGD